MHHQPGEPDVRLPLERVAIGNRLIWMCEKQAPNESIALLRGDQKSARMETRIRNAKIAPVGMVTSNVLSHVKVVNFERRSGEIGDMMDHDRLHVESCTIIVFVLLAKSIHQQKPPCPYLDPNPALSPPSY